jgi:hypothetical protein
MGCLDSKPLFNYAECREIMQRNDYYAVKHYINTKQDINQCDWADIIIMAISIRGFSYTNFVSLITEYNLFPVLNTSWQKFYYKLSYYNNNKSSYCYMHYNEEKLQSLLRYSYNDQFPGLAMLKTCIINNYINLVKKIIPQLCKRNIKLNMYYSLLSSIFNPEMVAIFQLYDSNYKPHLYLTPDQMTKYKLYISNPSYNNKYIDSV